MISGKSRYLVRPTRKIGESGNSAKTKQMLLLSRLLLGGEAVSRLLYHGMWREKPVYGVAGRLVLG